MPSTYSPNLKIELIGIGEQTDAWGSTTNDNFENVFEEAITGMATATFPSDADYNWAAGYVDSVGSQAQRNLVIEVIGTISLSRNFIVPTIEKQYLVHNNTTGGQSIVVKTAAGSGITIPNGQRAHLYVNGTDVIAVVNYFPSLRAGAATLDSPLPVTSGGTGSTSLATITVGTATNVAGGAANRIPYNTGAGATSFIAAPTIASTYLQWDGSAFAWATVPPGTSFSAGTTGFTPNTATTGAVVLGGILNVANGGTGQSSLTNVTVGAATNVAGGTANQIVYNTGAGTTSFVTAPTVASTYLQWNGSAFAWAAISSIVTTFSGGTTGLTPAVPTSGAVTLAGTLAVANGGTGVTTSTGTGAVVLGTAPTLSGPTINDGYTEEVFAIPSSTTPALSPSNGSIQTWTLTGNSTPTAGTWNSGQSIVLMIDDALSFIVTWTSVPVTWITNSGFAPTLATTGYTVIILWKVGSVVYGARCGNNT